jgi:hypothetical protein
MLRRKPTAITLTSEDISSYEDRSAAAAQVAAQELAQAQAKAAAAAEAAEAGFRTPGQQTQLTPQRGQNRGEVTGGMLAPVREKTRDERLGLQPGMGPRGGNSGRS